ncbi:MAG: TIGR04282 family arsenosugar biosynthesis glycosyltransferase [Pseudomonadota bacterium]
MVSLLRRKAVVANPSVTLTRLVQQFAKWPVLGRVKTRLTSEFSPALAFQIHVELMNQTAETLAAYSAPAELWLDSAPTAAESGTGSTEPESVVSNSYETGQVYPQALSPTIRLFGSAPPRMQQGATLGERMLRALRSGLKSARQVVLVGSDCPVLTASYLDQAFISLSEKEFVLGPAEDGGFVLLGASSTEGVGALLRAVTEEDDWSLAKVSWGTDQVLEQTLERLVHYGRSVSLLDTLYDIDRPADLRRWYAESGRITIESSA